MVHTIIITARIRIAQLAKKPSGNTLIISSVTGSNNQLFLPGKKILWNTVNALLKFSAHIPPIIINVISRPAAP